MDSLNSSLDQEKQGEQSCPSIEVIRYALATEPFQPILKVLADLERDDPKFLFPAARLVGFYRRLWESCVSKHIDLQKIEQSNEILKEAGMYLRKERDGLQLYHNNPNLAGFTDVVREENTTSGDAV
ncbi:unnamed protein product [Penicillium roqueforti FM164]|uniref:Genomic scaffold, ProqFM164S02 n=1 Tax=Penicillium roqueforti (strain FM164) TaxID=1365484 RepID=W6QEH9_PENRF|nr:unnamed protein product [Penicillium roqueforti FM164]